MSEKRRKKSAKPGAKHVESVSIDKVSRVHIKAKKINRQGIKTATRVVVGLFTLCLVLFVAQIPYQKPQAKVLGAGTKAKPAYSVFSKNVKTSVPPAPEISAKSALVVSTRTGKFLYAKSPDLRLPPASTTKILTALLAIREFDFSEVVSVPAECTKVTGSKIGLLSGEKLDVESLLYGLLVSSAGDAACTLSTHKFSSGAFVVKMNNLAREIGVTNTNFDNAIGLDSDADDQFSSARDLYLMAKEAMKNGTFRKIVGTKEVVIYSADGKYSHNLISTNKLMFDVPGSLGIKTGTTPKAKQVLVYDYSFKNDELIIVVMGSDDRFADTKMLLNYSVKNYPLLNL